MKNISHATTGLPSLLRKVVTFVVTAALIGLVLMFSVLLLAVILIAGVMAWGYLWWKTRDLRKQMRKHLMGEVLTDGEVRHILTAIRKTRKLRTITSDLTSVVCSFSRMASSFTSADLTSACGALKTYQLKRLQTRFSAS